MNDSSVWKKVFASFDGKPGGKPLPDLCRDLTETQNATWDKLSQGLAALQRVLTRELHCDDYTVKLQFNPARIISSAAPVDPESIHRRACFLCAGNLPTEQQGILYRRNYFILCNPYPVFPRHYTISHTSHIPQSLEGNYATLLMAARDFHPDFCVLYNGPECGASAPDHLHFQAIPVGTLPVEREIHDIAKRMEKKVPDEASLSTLPNLERGIIVVEEKNDKRLCITLQKLITAMRDILGTPGEPMVNILCSHAHRTWRVVIFVRRKHRPDVYFRSGEERVLISPGGLDMGGFVIMPREKDYATMDALLMRSIYREIAVDATTVQRIISAVSL